jgi:hypothetical protein
MRLIRLTTGVIIGVGIMALVNSLAAGVSTGVLFSQESYPIDILGLSGRRHTPWHFPVGSDEAGREIIGVDDSHPITPIVDLFSLQVDPALANGPEGQLVHSD